MWELQLVKGDGRQHANSPNLDRLDPAKGYVPGNVAVISQKANRIKTDACSSEIRRVADWLEKQGH
jgi:hypothetical protein